MRDAHGRVGGVDGLAAGTARPVHVDLELVGIDVDVDRIGFGQHGDRCRARVHPPLALGGRDPLHAVRPRLVLQPCPRVTALHDERDIAEAAHLGRLPRQHLEAPTAQLRVPAVHLEQVARPQVGLVAALGAADLHDDVLAVVGVSWDEQLLERGLELGEARLTLGELALEVLAHLRVRLGREQLAGVGDVGLRPPVLAVGVDNRLELGVPAPGVARGRLIPARVELGQLRLELLELGLEVDQVFEHATRVPAGLRDAGGPCVSAARS